MNADVVGQPQPEALGLRDHLVGGAEQQAAGDASIGARDRGAQGTGLGPFGQDDERVGRAGLLHHLVAEGGGREPAGPARAGQGLQPGRVQRIGDVVGHALDPVHVVGRQPRVQVAHPGRGLVAVRLDEQDGHAGEGGPDEPPDLRIGLDPRAEQQRSQLGPVQRGQAGGHDHLVPVAGHHDQPAVVQDPDAARDALGEHRHILDPPGQVALVQDLGVQFADHVGDPRPGQLRPVRHRGDQLELVPTQRGPQGGGLRAGCGGRSLENQRGAGRGQAVDHAADHARRIARGVSAGCDGELLGQALDVSRLRGPVADQQDVGVEGAGQRLVEGAGVQLGRPRLEPLDHNDIGPVVDRRPGRDDLLQDDVEPAVAELPL